MVAGYVAEQIAVEFDKEIKPNIACAAPDHDLLRQQLAAAGLSKHFDYYEEQARAMLKAEWPMVEKVAHYLYERGGSDVDEVIKIVS